MSHREKPAVDARLKFVVARTTLRKIEPPFLFQGPQCTAGALS